jgi:hypothetical protein
MEMDRETICDALLLWSRDEITALCDDELERLIERDWAWIRRGWEALFVDPPRQSEACDINDEKTEPLVSWPSWLWAHAIVQSRAVGMPLAPRNILAFPRTPLIGDGTDDCEGNLCAIMQPVFGEGVLLPIIDLINHGGCTGANAALELRPEGVAVVAKATISAGGEVLFDYDPNATLRSLLCGYGFVDCFSAPLRQVFRVELSRVEIDVTSTCGLSSGSSGIFSSGADDVDYSLPVMRVIDVIPSPGGGIRFVIRDSGHGLDGTGVYSGADRFADEGSLCGAVAACCSIVLDGMEPGSPCNDTGKGNFNCVALAYRAANVSLLRRCIKDLTTLASLLE